MLKTRVIPTLLWKDFGLVKGVAFDSWRQIGAVLPAVRVFDRRDVDELVLLDISATLRARDPDYELVADCADACSVPFTVGGGIRNVGQIQGLLDAGADKICINSAAYAEPGLVDRAAARFGSQCIVASIDARLMPGIGYRCFSHSGSRETGRTVVDWACELAVRGAGEILLTSIERDGTLKGYDLDLISSVTAAVDVPVVASGGAGNYQHMVDAVCVAGASAVAAASMFSFTEQVPDGVKRALLEAGVAVRQSFIR